MSESRNGSHGEPTHLVCILMKSDPGVLFFLGRSRSLGVSTFLLASSVLVTRSSHNLTPTGYCCLDREYFSMEPDLHLTQVESQAMVTIIVQTYGTPPHASIFGFNSYRV